MFEPDGGYCVSHDYRSNLFHNTRSFENWRRIFNLVYSLVLADRYKPEGFSYDLNLLNCGAEEGMVFEVLDLFSPRLNFQWVNGQLDEKQIICFQRFRNEIKLTQ